MKVYKWKEIKIATEKFVQKKWKEMKKGTR